MYPPRLSCTRDRRAPRCSAIGSPSCTGDSSPERSGRRSIGVLVLAEAVLWIVARPTGEPTASYVGQLLGAESILLLSIGLVLISTLPWVEEWFDGIDKAAVWHRRVAITGLILLAPHVLLSSNPDGTALGGPLGVDRGHRPGGARALGDPAAMAVGGAGAAAGPRARVPRCTGRA